MKLEGAGMQDTDDTIQAMFERLYERFNARDIDAVRDYWTRQWAAIDGTVTPQRFSTQPDGRIDVTVHQVVRNLEGELLEDTTVHHTYRLRDDKVEHMEIRK